jgi:hypothetical protein
MVAQVLPVSPDDRQNSMHVIATVPPRPQSQPPSLHPQIERHSEKSSMPARPHWA